MSPRSVVRRHWLLLTLAIVLGLASGCQEDSPLVPAEGSDIRVARVEVDRVVLGPGDSTEVRAYVVRGPDPGTPVAGATVSFRELLGPSDGTFSKDEALTDAQGWTSVIYRPAALDEGVVTLRIQAGDDIEYVLLEVAATDVSGVSMSLTGASGATSLPADGQAGLTVQLTVTQGRDQQPVTGLTVVLAAGDQFLDLDRNGVFSTGDQLVPTGDRNGNGLWDPEGTLPEEVVTDLNGRATFLYRSGNAVGPVYLKASGGGVSADLNLYQHPNTLQVTVEAADRELLADGNSSTRVTALVVDWSGGAIRGVVVKFVAGEPFTDTDEDGFYTPLVDSYEDANHNGQWDALGSVNSVATTDDAGNANVTYTAGLVAGEATLRATTTNGAAETTIRLVSVPPAGTLNFALGQNSVLADGVSSVSGTVTVQDVNGTLLAGKQLRFVAGERFEDVNQDGVFNVGTDVLLDDVDHSGTWTAMGTIDATALTDSDGEAAFEYHVGLQTGTVWIRAAVDGVSTETPLELRPLPSTLSMELSAASSELQIFGSGGQDNTTLTAACFDAFGGPVPAGVPVAFSITESPGSGERLDGAVQGVYETRTDGNGRASAVLISGSEAGAIEVQAASGSTVRTLRIRVVSLGVPETVECYADSSSLTLNSSTPVHAYVYDGNHNAVRDGTVVTFTTDEGFITGQDSQESSTTVDGVATATFYSTEIGSDGDGMADIVCEAAGGVSCVTHVAIPRSAFAVVRLTLETDLAEIGVRGTGATEQVQIRARGFDAYNRSAPANVPITFSIDEGPGGGEQFLSGDGPVVVMTNASGQASIILQSGTISGTVVVRAETGNRTSAHTSVAIAAGPPQYIYLGVAECNILACNRVNVENDLVCLVSDVYRNPVREGTVVYFTSDKGVVEGGEGLGSSRTARGLASAIFRSGDACELVTVTASTLGGTLIAQTTFIASDDPYSATYVSPSSEEISMPADGEATVPLRIEVLDVYGSFTLPADVDFETLYGTIQNQEESQDGCHASLAKAVYRTAVLDQDYSLSVPDDGIGAVDPVYATVGFGGSSDLLTVSLRTSASSRDNSELELESSVPAGGSLLFLVTVKDRYANPLGGHSLSITATDGTVTPTGLTDSFGVADGLVFNAPAAPGTVIVTVVDTDPTYSGGLVLSQTVTVQ